MPAITVDEMEQVLFDTATPLTDSQYAESPNNEFGHGLVNAYEAVFSVNGIGTLKGRIMENRVNNEAPKFEHSTQWKLMLEWT